MKWLICMISDYEILANRLYISMNAYGLSFIPFYVKPEANSYKLKLLFPFESKS
jgi:hypothetical protein